MAAYQRLSDTIGCISITKITAVAKDDIAEATTHPIVA